MSLPKKAGSLLVLKLTEPNSENGFFDYKILFLVRNKSMTFANTAAFPGGKIEPNDQTFLSNDLKYNLGPYKTCSPLHNLFKISALRETYEETGIFFTKSALKDESKVFELIKPHSEKKTLPDFYTLSKELNLSFDEDIIEFMRFVTPTPAKHRFDTQFFIMKADPQKTLNIFAGLSHPNELRNLDKLEINIQESSEYIWLNPLEALSRHLSYDFELAPPQIMIMTMLLTFKKYSELESYLKTTRSEAKKNELGEFTKDYPLTFPQVPFYHFLKKEDGSKFKIRLIFFYDGKFSIKDALQDEKSEVFRKEIEEYYSSVKRNSDDICRFFTGKREEEGGSLREGCAIISGNFNSPVRLLQSTPNFAPKPSL